MIEMTEPQPPAKEQALRSLESQIGASLPVDYRRFVLKHNGGWSHAYCMDYREKGYAKRQRFSVYHWLHCGLLKGRTSLLSVEAVLRNMSGELPEKAVPFAIEDQGDPLLLMLEPSRYGSVYFFSSRVVSGNLIKLAKSFTGFINGLKLDRIRA